MNISSIALISYNDKIISQRKVFTQTKTPWTAPSAWAGQMGFIFQQMKELLLCKDAQIVTASRHLLHSESRGL